MQKKNDLTLQKAMERMEEIGEIFYEGSISLDEHVKLFEEACKLYQFCSKELEAMENRVKILTKTSDGELAETPFDYNAEDGE